MPVRIVKQIIMHHSRVRYLLKRIKNATNMSNNFISIIRVFDICLNQMIFRWQFYSLDDDAEKSNYITDYMTMQKKLIILLTIWFLLHSIKIRFLFYLQSNAEKA
jgi:ABC-type uncharacterized transport system permease subunit